MAHEDKMCSGGARTVQYIGTVRGKRRPTAYKKHARCPVCKRSLKTYLHDLEYDFGPPADWCVMIPEHKKRGWWRKPKKRSRGK
jgi:hypothetical protein